MIMNLFTLLVVLFFLLQNHKLKAHVVVVDWTEQTHYFTANTNGAKSSLLRNLIILNLIILYYLLDELDDSFHSIDEVNHTKNTSAKCSSSDQHVPVPARHCRHLKCDIFKQSKMGKCELY